MKVLVAGADGQVGREMPAALAARGVTEVVALGRSGLDLTDPASIRRVVADAAPDAVVNCAAYNAVDRAEDDRQGALAVNAEGPAVLAAACAERGAHLVHISTDYVFDGTKQTPYIESDTPAPLSAYGESKLAGEHAVEAAGGRWTVVRTALVFGRIGRSLVELITSRLLAGEPLTMVEDQVGSPTHAGDLAAALAALVTVRATGVFHAVNAGQCTPHSLALEIAAWTGADAGLVSATTAAEFGRPARRPAFSPLASERLDAAGVAPLRPYGEAVAERVAEMKAGAGAP